MNVPFLGGDHQANKPVEPTIDESVNQRFPLADRYRFALTRTALLLNVGVLLVGLALLWKTQSPTAPLKVGLMHDLGMAFVIAVTITMTYESYVRSRLKAETMEGTLQIIMSDLIEPATWREVRDQILDKTAIRRHMDVEVKLRPIAGELHGHCLLWTSMKYRLDNLRSHKADEPIFHALDKYMHESHDALPRFTEAQVDGIGRPIRNPMKPIEMSVELPPRGTPGREILIQREELINIPGAYVLVMSELTEFATIDVAELPHGCTVQVSCYPAKDVNVKASGVVDLHKLLLPGQCVELRFFHTM